MTLFDKLINNNNFEDDISTQGKIIRELVSDFNQNNFIRTHFRENSRGISDFDKSYKYPEHIQITDYDTGKFKMEFLKNTKYSNEYVILQLHGGGYIGAFKNYYRTFAGLYSEVCKGASVLSIDYRVAPENPFPAALHDALYAFDWLLSQGYSEDKIIIAGDSAGGGLAMCLCHYLSDRDRQLPAGIIAMSPWTDLTASGTSYKDNYEIDPIFGNTDNSIIFDSAYIGNYNPRNPYISPLFGDFSDFPPMLIQVGSHEMLLSDSTSVALKAKQQGVKIRLSVYEGMFHVFQLGTTLMPESRKAWTEIGKFFEQIS
ncbi:MAG: alpha/beta hydrolase [Coprococcus sp.]